MRVYDIYIYIFIIYTHTHTYRYDDDMPRACLLSIWGCKLHKPCQTCHSIDHVLIIYSIYTFTHRIEYSINISISRTSRNAYFFSFATFSSQDVLWTWWCLPSRDKIYQGLGAEIDFTKNNTRLKSLQVSFSQDTLKLVFEFQLTPPRVTCLCWIWVALACCFWYSWY